MIGACSEWSRGVSRCVGFCWRRCCSERWRVRMPPICPIIFAVVFPANRRRPETGMAGTPAARLAIRRPTRISVKTVGRPDKYLFSRQLLQSPTSQMRCWARPTGKAPVSARSSDATISMTTSCSASKQITITLSSLATSTAASIGPIQVAEPTLVLPPGATAADGVTLNGNAALQVKDVVTFRGRAGWATGDFLPYIFGGLAVGRMDISRTVSKLHVTRTIQFCSTWTLRPAFRSHSLR